MKKFLAVVAVFALALAYAPSADAQVGRPRGGSFGQAVARGVGFGLGQRLGVGFGGGFGLNRFGLGLNQFNQFSQFNQFGYGGFSQFRQRAFVQPVYSPVVSVVQPVQAFTAVQAVQGFETECLTGACGAQAVLGSSCGYGAQAIIRQRAFIGGGLYGGSRFGAPLLRSRLIR